MTSVNATTATSTTTPATTKPATAATPKKSFDALFAEAKDDLKKGEKLTKVDGHQFARIKGGERDDMCVNLSGNARSGQAFDLIWREGRQFHVYGSGKDRHVVEVGHKAASTTAPTTDKTTAATDGTTAGTNTASDTNTSGAATKTDSSSTTTPSSHSTASSKTGTTAGTTAAASTGGATAA